MDYNITKGSTLYLMEVKSDIKNTKISTTKSVIKVFIDKTISLQISPQETVEFSY